MIFAALLLAAAVSPDGDLKARFYTEVNDKNFTAAVADGLTYAASHPQDDRFELDLAYAEINAGERGQAISLLQQLSHSSDGSVAGDAQRQLAAMNTPKWIAPPGYLYAYSQDEQRFDDVVTGMSLRYDLMQTQIRPYAMLNVSYDTRSGVPGLAPIYNDDAAVAGLGLRAPVGAGAYGYFFASGGVSIGLRDQPTFPEVRYGFAYSRDYGSIVSPLPHTQTYVNAAVYSRYSGDAISYADIVHDVRIAHWVRLMGGTTLALDSQRVYYNNFVEAYGGALVPVTSSTSLRILGVAGYYLPRGIGITQSSYTGLRILLVTGQDVR